MDTQHHPEEILERMGGCGKYQCFLSIMSHSLKLPTVLTMFLMVFSIATPKWWCVDTINGSLTSASPIYAGVTKMPLDFGGNNSSVNNTSSSYNNFKSCRNRNGTPCANILYDESMKTIVSEWSMSCDLSWVPSTIASIQMLAIFFGNLGSGQLADSFGRKCPLFGSQILLIVANLIGYFSTSWLTFGIARALAGLGMGAFLTVQYSLATEVSLPNWRPLIVAFPTWSLLAAGFALISYLMPDWRKLHLLSALAIVPFLALWWLALGLLTYGIQYGIQALSGNLFLNLFLFSIISFPVSFVSMYLSHKIGRRKTVILTYSMASVGCFLVGIVQYIDTGSRDALTNGFALFASLSIDIAWGPVQLMSLELYPTVVRNIGYGFLNTFSRIGAVIGPQIAYLDTRIPGVMYFVCCGVSVCCVIGTLFLSETKGADLLDKIQSRKHNETNTLPMQ